MKDGKSIKLKICIEPHLELSKASFELISEKLSIYIYQSVAVKVFRTTPPAAGIISTRAAVYRHLFAHK